MNRLHEKYIKDVRAELTREFKIVNPMSVPGIKKVVVNMGVGEISRDKELKEGLIRDLGVITGQTPSLRRARVSIAAFNLRIGMPVGLTVTLRRERMYDFIDKLFSVVLPRMRDFRGISLTGLDSSGNYTLGFSEHTVFPELEPGKTAKPTGMQVTIVTSAKNRDQAKKLLDLMGTPFVKDERK